MVSETPGPKLLVGCLTYHCAETGEIPNDPAGSTVPDHRRHQNVNIPGVYVLTELREYWRQLGLSQCPYCGSPRVLPSRPRPWDRALTWLRLYPYRCGRCKRRFHLRGRPSQHCG